MALATRRKSTALHHRKRQAQHHRRSKRYVKTYWPYLPMMMIAGIGLAINSLWSTPQVLGAQSNFSSDVLLQATNQQRVDQKEGELTIDPQLSAAAQAKAEDMVKHNYWAHNSPDGKTPWSFITASGYQYQAAGENLAYGFGSADDTITGWMNSAEHRANILDANYQNVGFGVAQTPNYQGQGPQTIVVAEYGQPVPAVATVTFNVPETADNAPVKHVRGANTELHSQTVSRIQVATGGQAAWATLVAGALAGAALAIFITRHSLRLHKALVKSERYMVHHPWLDISVVFIFTAGFLVTRTSGVIR